MITATAAVTQTARAAAEFINRETGETDLVIVSPEWAWLLRTHVADFQQAVAAEGHATPHFPGDIPPDQFAFEPRVAQLGHLKHSGSDDQAESSRAVAARHAGGRHRNLSKSPALSNAIDLQKKNETQRDKTRGMPYS